ncbi:hypothetical protein BO99DRAFT_291259, partial [Aspergillus violaceofuscus CBS 115571]
IYTSNAAWYKQSFRDITDQIKIPGRQNLQINIYKLIKDWLRDRKRGNWILILNNINNYYFFIILPTSLENTSKKAGDLVEELKFIPLAIIQAAGYI